MSPWRRREYEGHLWPRCCVETVCFLLLALWWLPLFAQPKLSPFVWTPKVNHLHPHPPNPHSADPNRPPNPLSQRLCRKDAVVFAALVQSCSGGEVGTAFNMTKHSARRRKKKSCECGLLCAVWTVPCLHAYKEGYGKKEMETKAGWVHDSGKKEGRKKHRYESLLLAFKSFRWPKPGAELYCKDSEYRTEHKKGEL